MDDWKNQPEEPRENREGATQFVANKPALYSSSQQGEYADASAGAPFLVYRAPVHRIPNTADAIVFSLLLVVGFLVVIAALAVGLKLHMFGWRDYTSLMTNTRVALGSQLGIYLVAFAIALPLYATMWGRGLMDGLRWKPETALRLGKRLVMAAALCNLLALLGNAVLPFPQHAPIDKLFTTAGDAWLLFAFGVTAAPFFEEMIFRGFLLPAAATAWDWCAERLTGAEPRALDSEGYPVWSLSAMIFASLVISAPFALMHAAQVSQAWGPLSLLYSVSLVLCAVRLATRSLAASMMVHACYNFMLFAVMLVQTDGFRHLDKI
uniref:CAAX prenyl protease 2/Lysostaphin resistance protein A-like domain-containing protein n=1 Tax=mine drainage metagenome TaxID=410659 RepID=E6QJP7_9ZZZZ